MGASVSHYLLETSRVVFQVRPTLLLTPCQLPEWERGRSHCGGGGTMVPKPPSLPSSGLVLAALGQNQVTAPSKPVLLPSRPRLSGASMFFMSC